MKLRRLLCLAVAAATITTLTVHASPHAPDPLPDGRVHMTARIDAHDQHEGNNTLEVTVLQSAYTSGPHHVILHSRADILDKNGTPISPAQLRVGDTVDILYSGQVMMSLPPQIVAVRIQVV